MRWSLKQTNQKELIYSLSKTVKSQNTKLKACSEKGSLGSKQDQGIEKDQEAWEKKLRFGSSG